MHLKILKVLPMLVLLLGSYFFYPANATTPEEYCKIHKDSGAPGVCSERSDCAILTDNMGLETCKKCTDGGCEITDCSNCSEDKEEEKQ